MRLPARVAALGAIVVLLVAAGDLALGARSALDSPRERLRAETAKPVLDRELAAAFNYDVSRTYILSARTALPERARYAFVTGPLASVSLPITVEAAPFVARYLLQPRREVPLERADWLLCFGCERDRLGLRLRPVPGPDDASGMTVARIVR